MNKTSLEFCGETGIKHTITQINVNEQVISSTKKRSYTSTSEGQYTQVKYITSASPRKGTLEHGWVRRKEPTPQGIACAVTVQPWGPQCTWGTEGGAGRLEDKSSGVDSKPDHARAWLTWAGIKIFIFNPREKGIIEMFPTRRCRTWSDLHCENMSVITVKSCAA